MQRCRTVPLFCMNVLILLSLTSDIHICLLVGVKNVTGNHSYTLISFLHVSYIYLILNCIIISDQMLHLSLPLILSYIYIYCCVLQNGEGFCMAITTLVWYSLQSATSCDRKRGSCNCMPL